jgi:hypothetical protein
MIKKEHKVYIPKLTAKSGRRYISIPDGMDIEKWDNMSVAERLRYTNLISNKGEK